MITNFKLFEIIKSYQKNDILLLDKENILDIIDDLLKLDNNILLSLFDTYGNSPLFLLVYEYFNHDYNKYKYFNKIDILDYIKKIVEKVPEIVDIPNDDLTILSYILNLNVSNILYALSDNELFDYLVDKTNNINQRVDDSDTILELLVESMIYKSPYRKLKIRDMIEKVLTKKPKIGLSLFYSIYSHDSNHFNSTNEDVVYLLIDAGADWNQKDFRNKTFLDYLENTYLKERIIEKYPEKYKKYIRETQAKKFKI